MTCCQPMCTLRRAHAHAHGAVRCLSCHPSGHHTCFPLPPRLRLQALPGTTLARTLTSLALLPVRAGGQPDRSASSRVTTSAGHGAWWPTMPHTTCPTDRACSAGPGPSCEGGCCGRAAAGCCCTAQPLLRLLVAPSTSIGVHVCAGPGGATDDLPLGRTAGWTRAGGGPASAASAASWTMAEATADSSAAR